MGLLYNLWKRRNKGVEILGDLDNKPEIPQASSIVQRLKNATEAAHQRRRNAVNKFKKNF